MATFTIEGYNSYSGCDIVVTASLPLINGQAVSKYYTLGSIQTLSISTHQDKRPVRSLGIINAKDYVMGPRTIAGSMVFAVFNKHFATEIMKDLGRTQTSVILPDEIPALDITISFANEYGKKSRMAIYGVKIINEGQVMSINDLYTENTYQFVALGLEPLSSADSNDNEQGSQKNNSNNNQDIISTDTTPSNEIDPDFDKNSGANISDELKNSTGSHNNPSITPGIILEGRDNYYLEVKAQAPAVEGDNGMATFTISPAPELGQINVSRGTAKKDPSDFTIAVNGNNSYNLTLPPGEYTAQYSDDNITLYSNTIYFIVDPYIEQNSNDDDLSIYPTIEKVTDNSIVITNESGLFDTINYFKTGGILQSIPMTDKTQTITNLDPNSEYNIFYGNSFDSKKSEIISTKTFENPNQEAIMFKNYIEDNSNILVNSQDDMIRTVNELYGMEEIHKEETIETVRIKSVNDSIELEQVSTSKFKESRIVIDAVLTLPDSSIKQELLIYAEKLTNQLLTSYNKDNPNFIKQNIHMNPFDSKIKIDEYDRAYYFESKKNKTFLIDVKDIKNDIFYGAVNKHYYVYGTNVDSKKNSVRKDFVICRKNYINELEHYRQVEKYKELDLSANRLKYNKYSLETVLAMTIKEHCYSDLNVLKPPHVYESDGIIYANINYTYINNKQKYYLVCAELHEALDYTPFRRVEFTAYDTILNLTEQYLGLIKGNTYLFWIENQDKIKLSKPYIFEYVNNNEFTELKEIHKAEIYSKIIKIKKDFSSKFKNYLVDELFDFVYDYTPEDKDLNELLEMELVNYCINSTYRIDMFDMFFELKKITHKNNQVKVLPEIKIDKNNRIVEFEYIPGFYLCGVNYSQNDITKIYGNDNIIHYGNSGYTVAYLISENMVYKSGFILIDCENNSYTVTSDLIDHIKEGRIH